MKTSTAPAPRPVGRREQRHHDLRAGIARAGMTIFAEQGYAACTVEDILREADVSRATFYSHFRGKADLARAIVADVWHSAQSSYAAFAAIDRLDANAIRSWLGMISARWQEWSQDLGIILRELPSLLVEGLNDRRHALVTALIGDGRHWRGFPPDEAERRASLLIFQLERAMVEFHLHGWEQDPAELIETLADIWAGTLRCDR